MPSMLPAAVVTGASRGIGRGIAVHLAAAGHAVVVNYLRSASDAREVVATIVDQGGEAIAVRADVAEREDRAALVAAALDAYGRIDVLVNNAGITSVGRRDLLEATEESWDRVLGTNLKGPFFLTQSVATAMMNAIQQGVSQRGTIINISSISSYAVSTNRADYCLAKAALSMMTRLYADRLAEHPIRVHEICPGIIASDMTSPVQERYDRLIAEGLTPIRRWGTPNDVAKIVVALTRDDFDFSTGQCFHADGGFHIRRL